MKKKLCGILFALVLCALVFPVAGLAAEHTYSGSGTESDPWIVESSGSVEWKAGYYKVEKKEEEEAKLVTINGQVKLTGNVVLTLDEDCTLKVTSTGVDTITGYEFDLTIQGNGKLDVEASDSPQNDFCSGITCADFTLNGDATVKTTSGSDNEASGIECDNLTINGGTLIATGGHGVFIEDEPDTFTMNGGIAIITGTSNTAISCPNFKMSGGSLTVDSATDDGISCDTSFEFDPVGMKEGKIEAVFKGAEAAVKLSFNNVHLDQASDYLIAKASTDYEGDISEIDLTKLVWKEVISGHDTYYCAAIGDDVLKQLSLSPKTSPEPEDPEPETPQSGGSTGSNNPGTGLTSTNSALPAVIGLVVLAAGIGAVVVISRKKNC